MSRRLVVVLACVGVCGPCSSCFAAEPGTIEVRGDRIELRAGVLARTISLASGNAATTGLTVAGQSVLDGPARELSVVFTRAEPNRRPAGLKAGQGGEINSATTFAPGKHVDPARYDDRQLGQTIEWIAPVQVDAGAWSTLFGKPVAEVTRPAPGVSRLVLRGEARPGGPLRGVAVSLCYEVYDGHPVVRKWVEILNRGDVWRKIDRLTLDDLPLARRLPGRTMLTPDEGGVGPSVVGFASEDGTHGLIAANEIPSALHAISQSGAMGYNGALFEWVLGPGEGFASEPVFYHAFAGPVAQTPSAVSTPLDRAVEGPYMRFLHERVGIAGDEVACEAPQWLTWETFFANIDDRIIRRQADLASRAGFVQFLIDDGWQRDRLGTEPNAARFPDFAETAKYIRSRGMKLGLWLSCFRDAASPDLKVQPNARSLPVVKRLGGVGMSFGSPWRDFYVDDLANLQRRFGVAYFKQDFSNILFGDLAEGHESRTRKESLLRGLRGLFSAQDALRRRCPGVMFQLTHEIYWDTPGAPCDLAALKHAARYHIPPNACLGARPSAKPGVGGGKTDSGAAQCRADLLSGCFTARQQFYAHRGLPLHCLEFYGAATVNYRGSLSGEVQDRQIVSWLMGAPLVFSGDLSTLTDENIARYRQRFEIVKRLEKTYGIYGHFQSSGVPAPTDANWHWWGKLGADGCGAVVVVRGSGGAEHRAVNIPWVLSDQTYRVTALLAERPLGSFSGRQLQSGALDVALPPYGQEILELAKAAP